MRILVTGGAGYIGSHTCLALLEQGHEVVVFDNLYNASEEALNRVKKLTGKDLTFYKADMLDRDAMEKIFDAEKIDAVIHFAGLKAVGESVAKPWEYYHNIDPSRCDEKTWREEDHLQLLRYRLRRSGFRSDHRGVPEGTVHKPVRTDKEYAGADPYRYAEGRPGVECDPAPLLQSGGSS